MDASIVSFATARLVVERIASTHFDEICRLHRDPDVMRTLSADGNSLPDEVTREGLRQGAEHWVRHGFGLWIFHDKTDGRLIGRGGLKWYSIGDRDEVGLAYAVLSRDWGRGYATEMAEASLRVGFERLGFSEIASWTLPINRASQRVIEKVGFRYERDVLFAGLPHRFYRLSASDWVDRCRQRTEEAVPPR